MAADHASSEPPATSQGASLAPPPASHGNAQLVLAVLASIAAMHWARDFLIPVITAFFLAYTLQPIVNRLAALHVPRGLGAALVLSVLLGSMMFAIASLRDDAVTGLENLPAGAHKLSDALVGLSAQPTGAMRAVGRIAQELQRVANLALKLPLNSSAGEATVVHAAPTSLGSLMWSGSLTALSVLSTLALSLLLVFFLLQAGDFFRRKLVRVIGTTLSAKRATVEVLNDINSQVQNYMFMLLVTNSLLGLASWLCYSALGLEHASMWALVAAVLHLIPYLGPLFAAGMTGLAAFMQFESLPMASLVTLIALGLASVVGMFIVPMMSGRQAKMNPTAIFVALLFFGWLWGAWGLLLGIPLAVICKVIAERVDRLTLVAELLSD